MVNRRRRRRPQKGGFLPFLLPTQMGLARAIAFEARKRIKNRKRRS